MTYLEMRLKRLLAYGLFAVMMVLTACLAFVHPQALRLLVMSDEHLLICAAYASYLYFSTMLLHVAVDDIRRARFRAWMWSGLACGVVTAATCLLRLVLAMPSLSIFFAFWAVRKTLFLHLELREWLGPTTLPSARLVN